jgi:hypothetical protein
MFFLSPLLLLSRLAARPEMDKTAEARLWSLVAKMHRVPPKPINTILAKVFESETPLGHHLHFPWGTSVLAVLQKP